MATTWFITGTSSGLGRQLTEQLLARGDRVAATLRRPDALDDLRSAAGERLRTYGLDVTDGGRVRDVMRAAFADLGTVDVVVNNAGYAVFAAVEEPTDEQIRRVIDTNLLGSIRVIRAALPHLRVQGHGRIVQISTAGGQTTYPNFSYYHASKWGIEGFCETVAAEIAPFGIKLTIIEPGATPTGFSAAKETAPIMPEYDATPAGDVRRAITSGAFDLPNDASKTAAAIIDAAPRPQHACACRLASTPTKTSARPTWHVSENTTPNGHAPSPSHATKPESSVAPRALGGIAAVLFTPPHGSVKRLDSPLNRDRQSGQRDLPAKALPRDPQLAAAQSPVRVWGA